MRIVVLLLLLANVALLAYLDYNGQRSRDESTLLAQQLKPERIRLMTAQEVAALQPSAKACLEIGPLSAGDLVKARQALEALQPAPRMTERKEETNGAAVHYLQVREMQDAQRRRINEIASGFGETELRVCPAVDAKG